MLGCKTDYKNQERKQGKQGQEGQVEEKAMQDGWVGKALRARGTA